MLAAAGGADAAGSERRVTRRRAAIAALMLVAAAAAAAVALADRGPGRAAAPRAAVPAGETTATVSRRTLTESASVDGTLGYGSSMELYDRLSGTFTWLPAVGATIARGGTLFRVDELPVVLMYGQVPAYRALKEGVSDGPDVAQLNENLIALGYDPYRAIGDLEAFGEATAAAVRRWQKAEGLRETGQVELGRVIFAPGARRITTVHVTLGQDPPPARSPKGAEHHRRRSKPKGRTSPSRKPKARTPPSDEATSKEPKDSSKEPSGSSKEPHGSSKEPHGSSKEPTGSPAADNASAAQAELVLSTTSTQQLVQLKLKAEQQQLARIGELAPVALPGGGEVTGRIVEVGTVASEASGGADEKGEKGHSAEESSGEATIPVTLALTRRVRHLDEAPVSVQLVKSVRRHVLAVPATALFATAGDRYAVDVLEDGRRVEVPVTPGMFADGYVQVEGSRLREGQTVIEAE
jgi:peptidoglycan hydrolase-like protein with peptidoglycan-binding domain